MDAFRCEFQNTVGTGPWVNGCFDWATRTKGLRGMFVAHHGMDDHKSNSRD